MFGFSLQKVTIVKRLDFSFYDLSIAFTRVAEECYGPDCFYGLRKMILWRHPVTFLNIKTDYGKEERGITGSVAIRGLKGKFIVELAEEVSIVAFVKRKFQHEVEVFLEKVRTHLETKSIYKGKAITARGDFLDLSGVSLDTVVYNTSVFQELQTHIWTLIEKTKICVEAGIPQRRKILLVGPHGSGKTLAAFLTAQKAVANGCTFIYLPPAESGGNWTPILFLGRIYQPSVLCIEDLDSETQQYENPVFLSRLLNQIDGMLSKNIDMIVVMTTNRLAKIPGEIQRPGRIDKIIDCTTFEGKDIERLLRMNIPEKFLDQTICWQRVVEACHDYQPAFVREVAQGALLDAIANASGESPAVTQQRLIQAAHNLRRQHENCKTAGIGFQK